MKTFTNLVHRAFKKCASLGTINKKRYYLFIITMLLTLGVGNAWGENAPVNTVLWGENFAHFGTKTPSDAKTGTGTTIYDGASITYTQSSTNTKAYNEKLAEGTAPELLLSKSNQTWTISGIKTGGATKMSLTFLSNKTTFSVTVSSASLSVSGSQKSWTITLKDGQTVPETFDLTIKNTGSSNARIDNVELKVTVAGTSSATPVDPNVTFSNGSYTVGQTLDLSSLWTSNSTGEVTYTVANAGTTGASISGSLFTATAAGTCTVKASQAATSAYNAIEKTATITVTAPTPATVTLSEAGQENTVEGKYVGDSYELPLTSTQTCSTKTFVGWSTEEIATPGDKPTSKFYEPGTTVTLAAEQTFYAVYAKEGEGGGTAFDGTSGGDFKIYALVEGEKKYLKGTGSKISPVEESEATEYTFTKISDGVFSIKTGTTYLTYASSTNLGTSTTSYSWTISKGTKGSWRIASAANSSRGIVYRASTYNQFGGYATSNITANGTEYYDVEIGGGSAASYTDYTTACEQETPATDLTDEQLKWSATTATALKGATENAFPELTNSLEVDVAYSSSNTSVATIAADGKITLLAPGTTTISAIFAGGEVSGTTYAAKTVDYTLTVKQLVSCADIYNLADNATFVLKDFVVTYVNGDYTYIKDDAGYGLIFTKDASNYDLKAGDKVESGKFEGKKTTYRTLVEIIPITAYGDLNATSGEAPAPEIMATNPTDDNINKYVKFEKVSFDADKFNSSKSINGTIEGQSTAIKFYNQFAIEKTFDTSKKYSVVGIVSIYENNVQIYFISAEEVAEPTLNVEITNADFGKIAIKGKAERTLTLNGSLLTNTVSLVIEGEYFTLASESVTPIDGNITDAKIKITYKPIAEGTHTATLKITSDDVDGQTITLTGQAVQQHTVHFFVNGEEDETLAKKVLSGNTLEEIPTATSCDLLNYPTFAGWTSAAIEGTTDVKPTMLDLSTPITSECNYYAVFEKATVGGSSEEQTETITIANFTSGDGEKRTCETNSATWTWMKNSGSAIVVTYEEIRLYQNHSMTISKKEGCDISKILATVSESKYAEPFAGELSGAEKTIDGNNITLTPTSGDIVIKQLAQSRVNSFVVTYTTSTTTYEYITSCAAVVPTCEITYDYAGGEGECTTDIVEKDTEYKLCASAPTKAGHTFLNWKDQNGVEYAVGATITSVTEDLTLTAQWQVNSYEVTWMSLGSKLSSSDVNYNTQPTQPTTNPTYLCGTDKEFVGWSTQEIDGIGVPANLYTDEFPVVTEAITYHAVFASKSAEETTTTSTLLVTEKLGNYTSGSMKDDQENVWKYYAGGLQDGETYYIALRNNNGEISYIESPKFSGTVQSIVAHVKNGSSKVRTVYLRSSAIEKPAEDDLGETSISAYNNSEVNLNITSPFDKFYIQVSDGLQFHKIVVTSGIAIGDYVDYVTSCEEVGSDMTNSTKVTPSVESGIFSVGAGKYVQFSTGNLQYEVGTNTWSFASEQYEVIGGEAYDPANPTNTNYGMNVPGYTGKLDLFGWSSDGKFGVNPSNADDDYTGEFADWDKLVSEEGWYTLTASEMHYLLGRKKDGKKLWTTAELAAELAGKVVLILLPDNWDTTIALEYGYVPATGTFDKNVLTIDDWKALEEKGAVLLPSGGSRTGGYGNKIGLDGETEETDNTRLDANGYYFHVNNVGDYGYYWLNTTTSSEDCVDCAAYLITPGFIENDPTKTEDDQYTSPQVPSREKRRGNSVRLVKAIKPNYTRDNQSAGVYGTVCYPENIVWCDGATLYEVAGKEGNKVIFDEVTAPEAGMPYIFIAEQEKLNFFCGAETSTEAGKHNSLQGTFDEIAPSTTNILVNNYILYNNIIKKCGANCGLYANRAYFVADDLENMDKAPAAAPGRRRISLDVTSENTATGLDNITNGENTTIKVIENGQLIIIRGGEKFNAQGQKL